MLFRKGYILASPVFQTSRVLHEWNNRPRIPYEDRERGYNVLAGRYLCCRPLDASIVSSAPGHLRRNVARNRMSYTTWKTTMLRTLIEKMKRFFLLFHTKLQKCAFTFYSSFHPLSITHATNRIPFVHVYQRPCKHLQSFWVKA